MHGKLYRMLWCNTRKENFGFWSKLALGFLLEPDEFLKVSRMKYGCHCLIHSVRRQVLRGCATYTESSVVKFSSSSTAISSAKCLQIYWLYSTSGPTFFSVKISTQTTLFRTVTAMIIPKRWPNKFVPSLRWATTAITRVLTDVACLQNTGRLSFVPDLSGRI